MNKNKNVPNNSKSSYSSQKSVSSSSQISSTSSTSIKYSSITSTSNSGDKVTSNGYKTKYNMATDATKVRPPISSKTTVGTSSGKSNLPPSYTPVYPPRRTTIASPSTSRNFTSINKPPPNHSNAIRNYSAFNEVLSSMPKQNVQLAPNKSQGLFYSFDDKQVPPKQSITVPAMITAAAFNNRPTPPKPALIDRPVPPPSLMVDRPVKKSFFTRIFSPNQKRGYALILNHYEYENGYQSTREGTIYDVEKLQTVFDKYRIETTVKTDLKLNKIKNEVNILKYKDFSKYECFIIVILTHGHRNEVLSAKDKSYNFITEIEDPLLIENKSLLDKPKIFVIQSCRGNVEMPVIETDSVVVSPPSLNRNSSVAKRNIFKCNATYEGYVSFRNTRTGTIFIQTFCDKMMVLGQTKTIYDIMMKVIDEVSNNPEIPQVPTIVSSMTNSFCFGSLLQ